MKVITFAFAVFSVTSFNAYSTEIVSNCSDSDITTAIPALGAEALVMNSPAEIGDPQRFNILCHQVSAGIGTKDFGILIAPPRNGINSVTYTLPTKDKSGNSTKWGHLWFKGTVGDKGLAGETCRGLVSFGATANSTGKHNQNEYWILAPVGSVSDKDEPLYKITIPPNTVQITITSYSGPSGQSGDDHCDHAFIAEPWLIP